MTTTSHSSDVDASAAKVLRNLRHGGIVVDAEGADGDRRARVDALLAQDTEHRAPAYAVVPDGAEPPAGTPFDYMFPALAEDPAAQLPADDPAAVVSALKALGSAMVEDPPPPADPLQTSQNSSIPAIYTYWGQFIDHDLTANTDREQDEADPVLAQFNITRDGLAPLDPDVVRQHLRNLRLPALNLDSVYGDGPALPGGPATQAADMYDGIKLRLGAVSIEPSPGAGPIAGVRIPPDDDLARDLPRADGGAALIGDGRNDENLIVAQFHVAFLRFHNATVDWVRANEEHADDAAVFERARELVRWHYQWLVVHDYLKTVCTPGVPDEVLLSPSGLLDPRADGVWMPLEFSVAAYRFGHSMVRAAYDYNRNFGRPEPAGAAVNSPTASFFLLFAFTGNFTPPFFGGSATLPFNWVIEWDRFVDKGDPFPDHFARRIDTRVAPPLRNLTNEGNGDPAVIQGILKRLAVRNLLRGYLLSLPTGQAVATALGETPLSGRQITGGNNPVVNDALVAGGFDTRTPLWFYVLKEAEAQADGQSLGRVGSRLISETIIGQIRNDPTSFLNAGYGTFTPADGVRLPGGRLVVTIKDFLTFATVL